MKHRVTVTNRLRMAVEDRFILLGLNEETALLPEGNTLERVGDTLGLFCSNYDILCDWSGLKYVTEDVKDVIDVLCNLNPGRIIATDADLEIIRKTFKRLPPIFRVKSAPNDFNYINLNLDYFDKDDDPGLASVIRPDDGKIIDVTRHDPVELDTLLSSGFLPYRTENEEFRERYLSEVIGDIGRNSLLTEFVIQETHSQISVTPYHAHAHYPIEVKEQLIVGRPGVVAEKTGSLLKPTITEFETILNSTALRESQIQSFLEQHPAVMRMLGYGYNRIYPQVILQRDDGTSLRPDFILEPIGSSWCDILDIKLPDKTVVVGGRDRMRFSGAVEELVAQLREYAAYFENSDLAKRVEEVYGIKCYKPRLIGIIGRDPFIKDERQFRRLQTKYADIDILTFDRLLKLAKSRPLI